MVDVTQAAAAADIRSPAESQGLRRNYLSLFEVLALAVAVIAPTAMPTLAAPGVFASSGNGTWLAYAVATAALIFVAFNINAFARHEVSPGALYVVAAKGCGPIWGVVAGWSLLIGYVFTAAALISGASGYLATIVTNLGSGGSDVLVSSFMSVMLIALAWLFAYRSVQLSSRTSLTIELITVSLIVGLILVSLAVHGSWVDLPQITLAGVSADQVRMGLVLAFFSYVGFEAATAVGYEAKHPFKTVPRAVLLSVVVCGVFFILASYGLISVFHHAGKDLGQSSAPLVDVAASIGFKGIGNVVSLGVAMSGFACTLGSLNAGARVLYSLAQHGLFPRTAHATHEAHATPHVALTLVAGVAVTASLALTLAGVHTIDAFADLGTLASFGFIFVYILVSLGTPFYLHKKGLLRAVHIVTALLALGLLAVALCGSIYPVPAWPLNIVPYVFLGLVGIGVSYFLLLRVLAPERLRQMEADLFQSEA